MVPPLRADPREAAVNDYAQQSVHLQKDEKKLEKMQSNRILDASHTHQAQQELNRGKAELSGHDEQLTRDVQHLASVEGQVTAGKNQKALDHQSYKEAVQKYGSDDPRCAAAKGSWKQSQQAMDPLLESRRTLKVNIHDGRRRVHNDKTVLSVQKRDMASDARYRAQDDRSIKKKEKNIADDRREMASIASLSEQGTSSTSP